MKKILLFLLLAVVIVPAQAATTTTEVYVTFDGTLTGTAYTLGADEVDTTGTFQGQGTTLLVGGGVATLNPGDDTAGINDGFNFDGTGIVGTDSFIMEAVLSADATQGLYANFLDITGNMFYRMSQYGDGPVSLGYWDGSSEPKVQGLPAVTVGQAYHVALIWDETANTLEGFLDGVSQGSVSGGELDQAGTLVSFGNFNHSGAGTGRGLNGTLEAVAFSTYTGTATAADFILPDTASNPTPTNDEILVPVETDGDTGTADLTTLVWDAPVKYAATGYDVYFGYYPNDTEPNALLPNYGLTKITATLITDTFIDASPTSDLQNSDLSETLPNYYWQVVTYEPNSPDDIARPGPLWKFTTKPAAVILNPGSGPVSQTVPAGTLEVTFTVDVTNGESYEWYKDGVALPDDATDLLYVGEDTAVLTVKDIQLADESFYHCVISNTLPSSATSATAQLMTERLAGWWKLDGDLTDSVQDEVAGAPTHDGSAVDPNFVGVAKDAGGIELTGDPNQLVIIADANDLNFYPQGYTVSVWVQTTQTSPWGAYVSKQGQSPSRGFILTHDSSGQAIHTLRQSFGDLNSGEQIDDDIWHLVTGTYDAVTGEGKVYVDGVLANQATSAGVAETSTAPLVFGAELSNGSVPYVGLLDDVRLWSYVLDPVAIATLYTDFNPGDTVCVAYPAFDIAGPGGVGDEFRDCVVNLYDFAPFVNAWLDCNLVPASSCSTP